MKNLRRRLKNQFVTLFEAFQKKKKKRKPNEASFVLGCHLTLRQTPHKSKFRTKLIFILPRKADRSEMKFKKEVINLKMISVFHSAKNFLGEIKTTYLILSRHDSK